VPDETRDLAAPELLANNEIEKISMVPETGLAFVCHSSLALAFEKNAVSYNITLSFDRSATCECLDFIKRGGYWYIFACCAKSDRTSCRGWVA
jgi:hypothetical protein